MTAIRGVPDDERCPAPWGKVPGRGRYDDSARLERLAWAEARTGTSLSALAAVRVDPDRLTGNIENMVGAVEVPVGLAGPLLFRGTHVTGEVCAPFATTEGALVASATRGATALSAAGGVVTRIIRQRMTRAPVFTLATMDEAFTFAAWIRDRLPQLRDEIRLVSRHAELVAIEPMVAGSQVHVCFEYETGEAAGQNMTTACTWRACHWIARQLRDGDLVTLLDFLAEANVSGDKKVTYGTFLRGRGISAAATCTVDTATLRRVLKVEPEQLLRANASMMAGSIRSGMIGYNINIANAIAAIFAATGQDMACVHECAVGHLEIIPAREGVTATMTLPSLIVGTVGGGTHLPAQRALLEMLGCNGKAGSLRLAEIIAGYCLALDLSTLSAIASGEFARAHERLGRNRPVSSLTRADLTPGFFERMLRTWTGDDAVTVEAATPRAIDLGSSILTELTGRRSDRLTGLLPFRLRHRSGRGGGTTDVVVKAKPLDEEVVLMVDTMAAMCGPRVSSLHHEYRRRTGFAGCHRRELAVYAQQDPRFTRHAPRVYGIVDDPSRDAYLLVLESVAGAELLDSADDVGGWTDSHLQAAVRGIAEVHAIWLGREDALRSQPWLGQVQTAAGMQEMRELWAALAAHAAEEFPQLVDAAGLHRLTALIESSGTWWRHIEGMPRTLIHNDFNPRNMAFRRAEGRLTLCAYDWELATLHLPQRDLAELLCFVLPPDADLSTVNRWIELHRAELVRQSGVDIDPSEWRAGYTLALHDFAITRMMLYLMAHTFRDYGFMDRTMATLWRLLSLEDGPVAPALVSRRNVEDAQ